MTAYYLKYRPQSLDEIIGQDSVKKIIIGAFLKNRLSHGYLLVGPRGTGKTSTARILAKMVNCEEKNVPCNKCATCLSITDGSNLDLIEIDAASNRGIEDIRSLREKIKLAPSSLKKKVYIIDEVHMLTQEAFNALLKTLEEPPSHALFILATTDLGKIPQTILSRVQRLDFKLATKDELTKALEKIIKGEKIDITDEAVQILTQLAEGSFRDAIKILDQVSALEKKIDGDLITKTLKGTSLGQVLDLMESFIKHDSKNSLFLISELEKEGIDFKVFTVAVMEIMRALMLIKNDLGPNLVESVYGSEHYKNLVVLADKFTMQSLNKNLMVLQKAYEKLKIMTQIPSLPLELAVMEICGGEILSKKEEPIRGKIDDRKWKVDIEDRSLKMEEEIHHPASILKEPSSTIQPPSSNDDSVDIQKLKEKWTFVLETVRPFNFSLEALLRSINVTECSEQDVIMEVPYSFHQRILEAPKNRDLLESIFSDILGRQVRVSTILGNRPARKEDIANVEVAQDDEIIRVASEIFNSDSVN